MKKTIFFFLLFTLLSLTLASGLKITGRLSLNYEPGKTVQPEFCVIPEGEQAVDLVVEGSLADYVELPVTELDLSEGRKCVKYNLTMPEDIEKPGLHKTNIKATEKVHESKAMISALVSVSHQVWVRVPYPGRYLEVSITPQNVDAGETVPFEISITNRGDEVVTGVTGEVQIFNFEEEMVGSVETTTLSSIESQQSKKMYATWNSSGNTVGDYTATATIYYGENTTEDSANFKLGDLDVRLAGYTEKITLGGIVPFRVQAESYWSQKVQGVKAVIDVINSSGAMVESFETLSRDLKPWEREQLKGFIDTNDLQESNYTLNISLQFEGGSNSYERNLEVIELKEPEEEQPGIFSTLGSVVTSTQFLLITTIILALIALTLAVKVFRSES